MKLFPCCNTNVERNCDSKCKFWNVQFPKSTGILIMCADRLESPEVIRVGASNWADSVFIKRLRRCVKIIVHLSDTDCDMDGSVIWYYITLLYLTDITSQWSHHIIRRKRKQSVPQQTPPCLTSNFLYIRSRSVDMQRDRCGGCGDDRSSMWPALWVGSVTCWMQPNDCSRSSRRTAWTSSRWSTWTLKSPHMTTGHP